MKPFEVRKFDLSNHELIEKVQPSGGSRPRLLFKHKINHQRFLLKTYSHNPREIWSELLASCLGKLMQINIQTVSAKEVSGLKDQFFGDTPPKNWVPVAALVSYAFPRDADILYGQSAAIMASNSPRFRLSEISEKIRKLRYHSEELLQGFSDMVIFDAWIGNMDRHHENWGVLRPKSRQLLLNPKWESKEKVKFATLFDHGSSLCFELSKDNIKKYLSDRALFERSYILGKAYTFFLADGEEKENIFSLLKSTMQSDKEWRKRFKTSIAKLEKVREIEIAKTILQMPNHDKVEYSSDRRNLLLFSLLRRREILLEFLRQ